MTTKNIPPEPTLSDAELDAVLNAYARQEQAAHERSRSTRRTRIAHLIAINPRAKD